MKKIINWMEFQKLYDDGNTISDLMKKFNIGSWTTVTKAKNNGLFLPRNSSDCQISKKIKIERSRIDCLIIEFNNGSSYHDLMKLGYKQVEYNYARDNNLIQSRSKSDGSKLACKKYGPTIMSEEKRKELSQRQSLNNSGGKSKWFEVSGQKVQGTWERNLANKFDEFGIEWIKLKVNSDIWTYKIDGKEHSYTPDFYLPEFNIYLEIKGYWWGNDKEKMRYVFDQHKDKKLIVIEKDTYLDCLKI